MLLNILPVIPVRLSDGFLIRRDSIISINIEPHWERVDGVRAKLQFQDYTLSIRWPFLFMFQLHVARYDKGDFLAEHADVVPLGKLYRIQFTLQKAKKGGELRCSHFIVNQERFKIFEPGKHRHSVTTVEEGQRLVLNFGIWMARRPKRKKIAPTEPP